MTWCALVISLPTETATVRMRAWRALKASGAAALRDGMYVLPDREACRKRFDAIAEDVHRHGGLAYVLKLEDPGTEPFPALFDRTGQYNDLLSEIATVRKEIAGLDPVEAVKRVRRLRSLFDQISGTDYFPGPARVQADDALAELTAIAERLLSPDEPGSSDSALQRMELQEYQARHWATRRRPRVDRLSSAWLIKRHIDPAAEFIWLERPAACPENAIGFDFDGATFTHAGEKVTFETLLACFGIETPALARLGAIIHALDVGGERPAEAAGLECLLDGLWLSETDDDRLLGKAMILFDALSAAFAAEKTA